MNVMLNGQQIEQSFDTLQSLDQYWQDLNQKLDKDHAVIQYIDIDQERVYTEFEQAIVSSFNTIKQLKIHTISELELLQDTIHQLREYNLKLIAASETVSDRFYGEMSEQYWQVFAEFSQGIEWSYNAMHSVVYLMDKHQMHPHTRDGLQKICIRMEEIVKLLDEALQSEEHTMVGDVIRFELLPVFEQLNEELPDQIGAES